ncbi:MULTISPECIES: aspartate kinase [unclassified Streptomyces]|uniref:aspartate kinase n=1 Tax=unclassified Streptomyces TaxID=2593676 RepID=UPI000F6CA6C4|nr:MULTISPECIES: aspartate kinase [unclassified Streptomyces]AZM64422.1 aspartate kinase [Streptomyces sp. WAC 01438]RSM96870.1 aspartate kinase [Streptomyces sp. WAC 01420]
MLVQKFGGTSLRTLDHVRRAAVRISAARSRGRAVAVVVSARGSRTDDLLRLAADVGAAGPSRELDQLLAVGESESAALMALALNGAGVPAVSLTGHQAGIRGTDRHGDALISSIGAARVRSALSGGQVAVVTGFQGVASGGDVVTLGRGGSDTTAVALAARLGASVCEIYTDVDGVFSADPRTLPAARRLPWVPPGVMAEMAFAGARVLHTRCIELAAMEGVEVHVRNASTQEPGTVVADRQDTAPLETRRAVMAVTHDTDVARVLVHCRDIHRDLAPDVFDVLAGHGTVVDLVARSGPHENEFRMGFTIRRSEAEAVRTALYELTAAFGGGVRFDENVGKVSVVGMGLLSRPEYTARLMSALAAAGIPTSWIATSQMRLSVVVPRERVVDAVETLHREFHLDRPEPAETTSVTASGSSATA